VLYSSYSSWHHHLASLQLVIGLCHYVAVLLLLLLLIMLIQALFDALSGAVLL